jgi:outer membrane protein OmpA-like peptidoglycan-associated protein
MTDGFDRGAIMARRALLISSALASFQCSNTPPVTEGPVETVTLPTAEPTPSVSATGSVSSARPPSSAPPLPPWEAQLASGPSRVIPDGMPESVKQPLTSLNALFTSLEKEVRQVWEPKGDLCNPSQPECRSAWRELGDALLRAREVTDRSSRSLCGGNVEAPAISTRREGYRAFFRERLKQAETHWGTLAASFGPLAEQEWQKQVSRSNVSPPMPCLSCMAPRIFTISTIIGFPVDSAALDAAGKEGVKQVVTMQGKDKRDLELWGIAAPGDKDANGIAKKRAEAVRDELVKNGYDKAQLSVIVIGAGLNEKTGQGRVEFLMKDRPS